MVLAHHLVWAAYGWWLPNDPRGSSSHEIRVERIAELGELHHGRKRVQPRSAVISEFYDEATDALKHPLLAFSPDDFQLLADSFAAVIEERGYTCWECAIMPDHVHVLMRAHRDKAEQMIDAFQEASRKEIIAKGLRAPTHPVWGGPGWKKFLNTLKDIERVEAYIRENPLKAGLPAQSWSFVKARR